jgi:hypothetical protein
MMRNRQIVTTERMRDLIKEAPSIKNEKMLLMGVCLLAALLFWFANIMNPNPGQTSGNGNPAILLAGILILLFCYLVYLWVRTFRRFPIKPYYFRISMAAIITHLIVASLYQRSSFHNYRNVLADAYQEDFGFVDWQYIDSITSFMSIHINNQYFNMNTYLMFLTSSILVALVVDLIQKSFLSKPLL